MKVPHTVTFEAIIDLDKVPSSLINQLVNLDTDSLTKMCKGATVHALGMSNTLEVANEGNYWAELTLADKE
jgi:hypothetical protein